MLAPPNLGASLPTAEGKKALAGGGGDTGTTRPQGDKAIVLSANPHLLSHPNSPDEVSTSLGHDCDLLLCLSALLSCPQLSLLPVRQHLHSAS